MRFFQQFALVSMLGVMHAGCDSFVTSDLHIDEGDDAGAGADPTRFTCADHAEAAFCDDFDGPPVEQTWDGLLIVPEDTGFVGNDSDAALSGESSLLVSSDELDVSDPYRAILVQTSLSNLEGRRIAIDFDFRVELSEPEAEQAVIPFQLVFGDQEQGYVQLAFLLEPQGSKVRGRLGEASAGPDGDWSIRSGALSDPLEVGEWTHVTLVLDLRQTGATGNQANLTVGEQVLFDGELTFALPDDSARLELGMPWVDTSKGASHRWRARFDNVLATVEDI
jgi:hypothetical protein